MTEPQDQPRTAEGRALLEHMTEDAAGFTALTSGRFTIKWVLDALRNDIPRIETAAAADALRRLRADVEAAGNGYACDMWVCSLIDDALAAIPAPVEPPAIDPQDQLAADLERATAVAADYERRVTMVLETRLPAHTPACDEAWTPDLCNRCDVLAGIMVAFGFARPLRNGVPALLAERRELVALVEAAEQYIAWTGGGHHWRCEYRTAAKGWKEGEPPVIECVCGLDEYNLLRAALREPAAEVAK